MYELNYYIVKILLKKLRKIMATIRGRFRSKELFKIMQIDQNRQLHYV